MIGEAIAELREELWRSMPEYAILRLERLTPKRGWPLRILDSSMLRALDHNVVVMFAPGRDQSLGRDPSGSAASTLN